MIEDSGFAAKVALKSCICSPFKFRLTFACSFTSSEAPKLIKSTLESGYLAEGCFLVVKTRHPSKYIEITARQVLPPLLVGAKGETRSGSHLGSRRGKALKGGGGL